MGGPIHLESKHLSVDVLPENGGRIASVRCRRSGEEFLLGGSNYDGTARFAPAASFVESDCAGIDECLPTVAPCSSPDGTAFPDHGDLWRHAWRVDDRSKNRVLLSTECFSLPLSFSRAIQVGSSEISLSYRIENVSKRPLPFLYAWHPLFAIDAGDQLILPRQVQKVRLYYSRNQRAGDVGEWLTWPTVTSSTGPLALDRAGKISDETAEMLYTARLTRGVVALYRARLQKALVVHFDPGLLPFLGLWLCNGGWPDEPASGPKQYAFALEPTVAPHGSLTEAVAAGAAPVLQPGQVFAFSLRMEVLGCDKPCSCEEVQALVSGSAI